MGRLAEALVGMAGRARIAPGQAVRCACCCQRPEAAGLGGENGLGRAVSRILSRPLRTGERHLSRQPIPGTWPACADRDAGRVGVPYWALLPGRFSVPRRLRAGRWALTPPFHPYRRPCDRRRFVFCGTVCRVRLSPTAPAGMPAYPLTEASGATGFRGPAPYGVRTFLPQLAPRATLRPSKTAANLRPKARRQSPKFFARGASTPVAGNRPPPLRATTNSPHLHIFRLGLPVAGR